MTLFTFAADSDCPATEWSDNLGTQKVKAPGLTLSPDSDDSDRIIDTSTRPEILQDNNKYRNGDLCIGKGVS